jgi:hypothetical protein
VLRVDGHSELTREEPEPVGIVRSADHPVVVEVEARGDARVGRRRVAEGVEDRTRPALADGQVVLLEEAQRQAPGIEVELVDQQNIRADALDDLRHRLRLRILRRREVGDELALAVPVERGVEGREADALTPRSSRGDEQKRNKGGHTRPEPRTAPRQATWDHLDSFLSSGEPSLAFSRTDGNQAHRTFAKSEPDRHRGI